MEWVAISQADVLRELTTEISRYYILFGGRPMRRSEVTAHRPLPRMVDTVFFPMLKRVLFL